MANTSTRRRTRAAPRSRSRSSQRRTKPTKSETKATTESTPEQTLPPTKTNNNKSRFQKNPAYKQHVDDFTSGSTFRSTLSAEVAPRSVLTMVVMVAALVAMPVVSTRMGLTGGQQGILGSLVAVLFYCFLHTRDGIIIRPHPSIYRVIHGFNLHYMIFLAILCCVPLQDGLDLLALVVPSLQEFRDTLSDNDSHDTLASPDLDVLNCAFTWENVRHQLVSMWFMAHAVGWWAKFCIYRDWRFCLALSVTFEMCELSLQWLIPEFKECWWDSIFMDTLIANMVGMVAGVFTLRFVDARDYNWVGRGYSGKLWNPFKLLKSYAKPGEGYEWGFFEDAKRFHRTCFLFCMSLATELNAFFLIHSLQTPAQHPMHKYRLVILCFLALSAVSEHFEYIEANGKKRLGPNTWLFVVIVALEFLVIFRYGKDYQGSRPEAGVWVPWLVAIVIGSLWCSAKFSGVTSTSAIGRQWVAKGGYISMLPLLALCQYWKWA